MVLTVSFFIEGKKRKNIHKKIILGNKNEERKKKKVRYTGFETLQDSPFSEAVKVTFPMWRREDKRRIRRSVSSGEKLRTVRASFKASKSFLSSIEGIEMHPDWLK